MAGGDDRKNFALEPYEVKSMKQLRLFAAVCAALLAVAAPAAGLEKPKYIFLFIGDGMGAPQVSLAAEFCGKPQLFDGFETVGLLTTWSLVRIQLPEPFLPSKSRIYKFPDSSAHDFVPGLCPFAEKYFDIASCVNSSEIMMVQEES